MVTMHETMMKPCPEKLGRCCCRGPLLTVDPLGHGPLDALDDGAGAMQGLALQLAVGLDGVEQHRVALDGLGG